MSTLKISALVATMLVGISLNVATASAPKFEHREKTLTLQDLPKTLQAIAYCESGGRHYTKEGQVIQGFQDVDDTGVLQINRRYHGKTAERLGFNLETLDGNIRYGIWLFSKEGTQPWNASKKCWGPKVFGLDTRKTEGSL